MKCSTCGKEHDLLEPTFRRPDAVFKLQCELQTGKVKENDDLCTIEGQNEGESTRSFVRCVLNVALLDSEEATAWGLWAEVNEADFQLIVENWTNPLQDKLPPIPALIANRVPGYPDTTGLRVKLKLTGPTSRPQLFLENDSAHPFARECLNGVCSHRVMEWLESM